MKQTEAGFTLMETLLSVAIILIFGSGLVIASNTAIQSASLSIKTIRTATTLATIDRYIRIKVDSVHIPYWANTTLPIDTLVSELYLSKIGTYIKSVRIINGKRNIPRGIEVVYVVNNREMRTTAAFPSVTIMDVTP